MNQVTKYSNFFNFRFSADQSFLIFHFSKFELFVALTAASDHKVIDHVVVAAGPSVGSFPGLGHRLQSR